MPSVEGRRSLRGSHEIVGRYAYHSPSPPSPPLLVFHYLAYSPTALLPLFCCLAVCDLLLVQYLSCSSLAATLLAVVLLTFCSCDSNPRAVLGYSWQPLLHRNPGITFTFFYVPWNGCPVIPPCSVPLVRSCMQYFLLARTPRCRLSIIVPLHFTGYGPLRPQCAPLTLCLAHGAKLCLPTKSKDETTLLFCNMVLFVASPDIINTKPSCCA